jgi:Tol biopolymer transport system component
MSELKEVFDMVTKQTEPEKDSWKQQEQLQVRTARKRKLAALAVAAVIVAALALVFARAALPTHKSVPGTHASGSPASIPFNTLPPIGAQIVAADGTPVQQLKGDFTNATNLQLSPDATSIAYITSGHYHVAGVDGTYDRIIGKAMSPSGHDAQFHLSWSPDGSKLVYSEGGNIYVARANGSGKTLLVRGNGGTGAYYPVWSPDGAKIAYWSGASSGNDGGSADAEIYVISATGGTPTRLTHNGVSDIEASWSPDSQRLAYFHDGQLWVMGADGSQQHRVRIGSGDAWAPAWSPDGSKIAFLTCCDQAPETLLGVRVLDLRTGNVDALPMNAATDLNGPQWVSSDTLLINRFN